MEGHNLHIRRFEFVNNAYNTQYKKNYVIIPSSDTIAAWLTDITVLTQCISARKRLNTKPKHVAI
jgi:hypothetical protein